VWLGLPDPLDTLKGEAEIDPETEALRSLLLGLELLTTKGAATSQRILDAISHPPDPVSGTRPNGPLAAAIGELVASSRPTAAQLSRALAPFVSRVLDGRKLVRKRTHDGWVWSVIRQDDSDRGSSGGSDDESCFER
jgi:hypothetical protein